LKLEVTRHRRPYTPAATQQGNEKKRVSIKQVSPGSNPDSGNNMYSAVTEAYFASLLTKYYSLF